jgi:uncharacterized membrane protein YjdF
MKQLLRQIEVSLVAFLALAGSAFLLKMCYLSLAFNTAFGLVFLMAFYGYVRVRHDLNIPPVLLVLVFLAVQVDAVGNYFHMYGKQFGPIHYDEFSHMTVQALVSPLVVWLTQGAFDRLGQRLALGLSSLMAAVTMFSLSAFYEIIELWDEVYFNGHRIWSTHDTANDLQWDLLGILVGTLLANLVLRLTIRSQELAHRV